MKFLIFTIFAAFWTGFASCQSQPIKIVFETTRKDTATKLNETKIYILKKETENSDFNYSKLENIDSNKMDAFNVRNLIAIFEPVNGQYRYYQFLSTFVGEGYNPDGPPLFEEFHDVLIIKTDDEKKIIDAYQYTLEWAEPPLQYDVFKSSIKDISLVNNMDIIQLKFKRTYSDNNELEESGIIKLR